MQPSSPEIVSLPLFPCGASPYPTMYDLPSEYVGDPGLPDEFHGVQAQFLSQTFQTPRYSTKEIFTAIDINLYYDLDHSLWYKRPDWMAVVGVSRFYHGEDLRLSYVVWDEKVNPFIIVELLSPGTEKEDLGETSKAEKTENGQTETPPGKWQVYEKILQIPYYAVFSRYTNQLRVFKLVNGDYQELALLPSGLWMPELEIGLGLWQGEFQGLARLWLRWYDAEGNWLPTEAEKQQQIADRQRQRAEQAESRASEAESQLEALRQRLRAAGINPEDI